MYSVYNSAYDTEDRMTTSTGNNPGTAARRVPTSRSTYRHGDLRAALVRVGVDLAAEGGPDAVVLRETTRRAGVSPNAAYRHFADHSALLGAVANACQGRAADAIEEELAALPAQADPALAARAKLSGVGRGYLRFAQQHPGLFRTAFSVPDRLDEAVVPAKRGKAGRAPFQILSEVIDELVVTGALPPERRPGAELLAWSTVHGLGLLIIDGPLRGLTEEMIQGTTARLLAMVDRGL